MLQYAHSRYATESPLYIPHKRESAYSRSLAQEVGFPIREFDDPIEVVLASNKLCVSRVSSFFCSALINLKHIFGQHLLTEAIRIPDRLLMVASPEVAAIYANMQAAGISTVEPESVLLTEAVTVNEILRKNAVQLPT